jgi:hypothetical protein
VLEKPVNSSSWLIPDFGFDLNQWECWDQIWLNWSEPIGDLGSDMFQLIGTNGVLEPDMVEWIWTNGRPGTMFG